MDKEAIIKTLEDYGVNRELYENATNEQKRLIEESYGINGNAIEINEESKENAPQFQKKITNNFDSMGYINSFIVVFTIGVLGGMIAMFLLSLAK